MCVVGVTLWDRKRNVDILEEANELQVEEQLRHWSPSENARKPATEEDVLKMESILLHQTVPIPNHSKYFAT